MTFTPSQIATARDFVDKIKAVFADLDATSHHLESAQIADGIAPLIRPDNRNEVVNLANEIIAAKIETAVEEFLGITAAYYFEESRARRVAEASDLVASLSQRHRSLMESPSIDQGRYLQELLTGFIAQNAPSETTANFAAHSKEETAAPSSDLHEKGATAEQQAHTIES